MSVADCDPVGYRDNFSIPAARLGRLWMTFSISPGSGWRFTRAEYLPALAAALFNSSEILTDTGRALVQQRTLHAVLAGAVGLLMIFRLRLPRATVLLAVVGDWFAYAPAAVLLALFTLAHQGQVRTARTVAALVVLIGAFTPWITGYPPYDALFFLGYLAEVIIFIVAPVAVGSYLHAGRVRIISLSEHTARLEREQQLLAKAARSEERTRIAREMHDVVAHRVTHIVMHAGSLQMNVGTRTPEWAAGQAELIRTSATKALEELHDILKVLRRGREGAVRLAPPPGIEAVVPLIEETRKVGLRIDYACDGEQRPLSAQLGQTIYRLVQETLTNALKYAGDAPVVVRIGYRPDRVDISVNSGPSAMTGDSGVPSGGQGLIGLTERVELLGGTVRYGPTSKGDFRFEASLPTLVTPPRDSGTPPQGRETT
ncbi:sensor histidine kinase [Streptomyces gamaensis]|uniref:histidine kinase n=1 Tax=Streptomyces gamaensis TaxID=1763542 RepID=A0ABW0Z808_9ACTN